MRPVMGGRVLVDAGFLVALLSSRDRNHDWAAANALALPIPWSTCDAALSEAFHLLGRQGMPALAELLRRRVVVTAFDLGAELERALAFMDKYANVPMSLADACLLRMTETTSEPVLVTTDADFRIYRRHGRQAVPCVFPE